MSKKTPKKDENGTVITMEKPDDSPDTPPIPEEKQPDMPAAPAPQSRIRKDGATFFESLRKIALSDWGSRYYLYLYRLEPVIDRLRSGETKYVMRYSEPIDEEKLMLEHGSGRYRLNLVGLKPATGNNDGTEIGRYECDILNIAHPPKIPKGEWTDDPRNKKWAWAKEKEPDPPPAVAAATAAGTVLDAMRTVSDIRKEMRQEMTPAQGTQPENPVATALTMAKDLLQMRADNPMVDIMKDELKAMRDEIAAERAENRKLQAEMRIPTPAEKSDPIDTLVKAADKLQPLIDKFMNKGGEVAEKVVNGRRPRWWETMLENATPGFVEILKPFGAALAAKMMTPAQALANGYANVGPQPAAPQPGVPQIAGPVQIAPSVQPKLIQFLSQPLVMSSFISHFTDFQKPDGGEAGFEFAYWIFKSGGEQPLIDARAMGSTQILTMFKGSPAWPSMQPHEAKLTQFLDQILSWKPEMQQPLPPPDDDDDEDESEDLTGGSL